MDAFSYAKLVHNTHICCNHKFQLPLSDLLATTDYCNHIHTEAKLMHNVTDNWLDKHGNWLNRLPWVRVHVHIDVIKIKTYTQS